MKFFPWSKAEAAPAQKSTDLMPEWAWDQLEAQSLLGSGAMNLEQAVGLPALLAVIRLIAHAAGLVPLEVFRVDSDEVRKRARDTWQWRLLYKRPGPPPTTPFNFKADLAASFAGRGNAYVRKLKPAQLGPGRPRVLELMPVSAAHMKPRRAPNGAVIFDDSSSDTGMPVERSTKEIIQIRSFALGAGLEGLAPITAARLMIQAGLKRHQFEASHFANGIFPGIGLKFPEGMKREDAERWLELLESQHQGAPRAGKTIVVGGGAELIPIPISLEDAQFADSIRLTLEQACAIYQVPLAILTPARRPVTDDDWRALLTFGLGPLLTAMAEAFAADDDLFAPREDDALEVCPAPDALMRLDPLKKAQIQREQTQTGTRLVDELRNEDGLAPLPPIPKDWTQEPGKVPQITPVGGAPNPLMGTGDPPAATDPNADDPAGN